MLATLVKAVLRGSASLCACGSGRLPPSQAARHHHRFHCQS